MQRPCLYVRCYAELNDYLAESRRGREFCLEPQGPASVRSVINLLAIPESEIDVVLLDGASVGLDASVRGDQHLSLYPVFESFDISTVSNVRPVPLREPRFILDVHLGKLATFMRMLGLDAMYETGFNDDELVSISVHESRALLSKDRKLLEHPRLTRAYFVKATDPKEQLVEVLARFQLSGAIKPFTRCLVCNSRLVAVSKAEASAHERVPERVLEVFDEFYFCAYCPKIYWKGSHYERMRLFIAEALHKADDAQ